MKKKLYLWLLLFISFFTIKSVYAETYNGEYSIEYLLRNYNAVTLGKKDDNLIDFGFEGSIYYGYYGRQYNYTNSVKGDIASVNIDGAILINGNYNTCSTESYYNANFGSQAGNIKSFIKGTKAANVTTTSQLITDSNYIDFDKMYSQILNESRYLADNAEYHINSPKIEISNPGNYLIENTSVYSNSGSYSYDNNEILIKNYDRNSLYVFNYYNEFVGFLPNISIMKQGASNTIPLSSYIYSEEYTGNIIFNFPNARLIDYGYGIGYPSNHGIWYTNSNNVGFSGNIIAPKATVRFRENPAYGNNYYGTIIANFILSQSCINSNIKKNNYNISEKIIKDNNSKYTIEATDYSDDYYSRDYSIKDLLENYSLITLGHKSIDSKSKILEYGNTPGSVKLFHITGQALIAGDIYGKVYENERDDYYNSEYYNINKYDRTAFDLESNKVTESYIRGKVGSNQSISNYYTELLPYTVIQPWDNMAHDNINYIYQKNNLLVTESNNSNVYQASGNFSTYIENYVNFDRLYENVVAEQSEIEAGKTLSIDSNGILHIPIGGNYTIEDISNVKEIVFDNFEKNKDELTIITIKNDGDINFPLISKNENMDKAIITNDYFGKEKATHLYELDTFLSEDSYYGNIVWNLPNAGYIKLKENAPFAGHMIAPNADVETPELHFAGCFIVNSIYGEGNTEAHFYPIRSNLKCVSSEYDSLSETQKKKFNDYRLRKSLGGDNSTIEKEIIGDKAQYDKDVALFESLILKCDNREIIINPETAGTIAIILGLLTIGSITLIATRKTKKTN